MAAPPQPLPHPPSVDLALKVRRVALSWLMRARRRLVMVAMVEDIRQSELAPVCAQCGGVEELTVEEFVEARQLWTQFEWLMADVCRGWSGTMKAAYAEQHWRVYYHQSQSFRTRCWRCRQADLQPRPMQPSNVDVSDDEDDGEQPPSSQQVRSFAWAASVLPLVVRFSDQLKRRVRQRHLGHRPLLGPLPPVRMAKAAMQALHDVSDDEDEEQKEEEEDEVDPLRDNYRMRPTMAEPAPVRGDISDDDDEDEPRTAPAQRPRTVARGGEDEHRLLHAMSSPLPYPDHGLSLGFPAASGGLDSDTQFDADHFHFTAQPRSARRLVGSATTPTTATRTTRRSPARCLHTSATLSACRLCPPDRHRPHQPLAVTSATTATRRPVRWAAAVCRACPDCPRVRSARTRTRRRRGRSTSSGPLRGRCSDTC